MSAITVRKTDVMLDWAEVHQEMTKQHVTLALLWTEYRESHAEDAYGYTQFRKLDQ